MSLIAVYHNPSPPVVSARERISKIIERLRRQAEDEDELVSLVAEKLKNDTSIRLTAAAYLVRAATIDAEAKTRRRAAEPSPRERIARKAQEAAAVKAAAKAVREKCSLDLMMPNNKQLRFCTGADCRGFGDVFAKLAAALPDDDTLVGEVLTEGEVRELFNGSLDREGIKVETRGRA